MDESRRGSPLILCSSCGKPQPDGEHLCRDCGSPLTAFAHTDPVMGVLTRGFAAHQATTNPRKLIVVVGMWLWLFPLLIIGLCLVCGGSVGVGLGDFWLGILVLAIGALLVWISATILWRTTFSYLRQQRLQRQPGSLGPPDESETEACLHCGEEFAADITSCPACGWSFGGKN